VKPNLRPPPPGLRARIHAAQFALALAGGWRHPWRAFQWYRVARKPMHIVRVVGLAEVANTLKKTFSAEDVAAIRLPTRSEVLERLVKKP
jgi:hypothetical protein